MTLCQLAIAIIITFLFVLAEGAAGLVADSLGLISDSAHNLADGLSLCLSFYAMWMARRPADSRRTFGYHRMGILAALANSVALLVMALWIAYEAVERFMHKAPVNSVMMMGVAAVALAVNLIVMRMLHHGAKHDINIRSSYIHMLGDALVSLGVVVAGAIIYFTGWEYADALVSLIIAVFILFSGWGILAESINILLEGTPKGLDMAQVEASIRSTPGVLGVHDLHVWTVSSGIILCSCHIVIAEQSIRSGQKILREVAHMLEHRFHIGHSTIQIEVEGCMTHTGAGAAEIYCTLEVMIEEDGHHGGHGHHHHH